MIGQVGKLDRRITIQKRTVTRDSAGGKAEAWADAFSCWAQFVSRTGKAELTADADKIMSEQLFIIRHRNIEPGEYRVLYNLVFYNVFNISENGRRDRIVLSCKTVKGVTQ